MLSEALWMALRVIRRNPGRGAITVLGLAIGVATFIAMVSFGEGARRSVLQQFATLGTNVLHVRVRAASRDALTKPAYPLREVDVASLRRESTTIGAIVPQVRRLVDVQRGALYVRTALVGTVPEYPALHGLAFQYGGMFNAADDRTANKVCVLGATPARRLFGEADTAGANVVLNGRFPCRVIGVLAGRARGVSLSDVDDFALMPLRTFQVQLGIPDGYTSITLRPERPAWLEAARLEADAILRRAHHYEPGERADFDVVSPDDVMRAADRTARLLGGLLACIAAVSLLVGGIGIMNIQLVAVSERTREIGILAAIGATPRQILKQFLTESAVLAAVGTFAGIVVGVGVSEIVGHAMGWGSSTSLLSVLGSAIFGIVVGVAFGCIPAMRAARLDPIEALRHE